MQKFCVMDIIQFVSLIQNKNNITLSTYSFAFFFTKINPFKNIMQKNKQEKNKTRV